MNIYSNLTACEVLGFQEDSLLTIAARPHLVLAACVCMRSDLEANPVFLETFTMLLQASYPETLNPRALSPAKAKP